MNRLTLIIATTATLLSSALLDDSRAHADFSAYSCAKPAGKRVEAILAGNGCAGFKELDSQGALIREVRFARKSSGRMIASADGRSVIMVESNLYGHIDKSGKIEMFDHPTETDPVVVSVYRDGILVAAHRASKLFMRRRLLSQSISHTNWVRSMPTEIVGKMVTLETTAFREITLEARSGTIVSDEDSPDWTECDVIATGIMAASGKELIRAFDAKTFKGGKTIAFTNPKARSLPSRGAVTVCLARANKDLALIRAL